MAPSGLNRSLGLKHIEYSYLRIGPSILFSICSYSKQWRESAVQVEDGLVELEEPDAPEYYETEKILWRRWAKALG